MRWLVLLALIACSPAPEIATRDAGADSDSEGDALADDDGDASGAASSCDPGSRPGNPAGETITTKNGIHIVVRTPPAYAASVPIPFVMVYSPCCGDAAQLEQFTGLTPFAKARGYLVAYADHVAGSPLEPIMKAAEAIPEIASRWCVDQKRVYVTGHSDGASIAEVIGVLDLAHVTAIAPSAAGFATSGAKQVGCRKSGPLSVMEIHSIDDAVFPVGKGYGADVAAWWASCDGCAATASAPAANGCVAYIGCSGGVEVQYCQRTGAHGNWPLALDSSIFDFFDRFTR